MLFRNRRFRATTAVVVLAAFGWMTAGGNAWAESRSVERDPAKVLLRLIDNPRLALSPEEKDYLRKAANRMEGEKREKPVSVPASHAPVDPAAEMNEMASDLTRLARRAERAEAAPDKKAGDPIAATARVKQRLETSHKKVLRQFAETESLLRSANLPKVIFERHKAAQAEYMENIQSVFQNLDTAAKSQDDRKAARSALLAAAELLNKSTEERPSQQLDPTRLPFRAAKTTERKPFVPKQKKAGGKAVTAVTEKLVAPTAADLAATEDVQITPEIQALASSLGNQPLKIYNWVRNNIQFVPTQGSVQGAQMTLVAKRGNAYDISSLLIALLRSSGIHSKYVTGTTEVPVDKVKNWVGGAENASVAQQILGQGGVPNVGLNSGGTITHIRIEHVWVEAFLDYIPSRGAMHVAGDTWVPMDAAFKQHTFTAQSDLFAENPIEDALLPAEDLMDVDESLGKITNGDDSALDARLVEWADRSDSFALANGVEGTVDGVLGGKKIIQETRTTFAASLPYQVLTRQAGVGALPANLRHYVTLNGFDSIFGQSLGDPSFSVKLSLPALNSKRLGIQFEPATQADADTLAAARANGASSLPVYLVKVVPVIKLDGVEMGRGGSVQMGSLYPVDVVLQDTEGSTTIAYQIVAGDEIVAGITGNGVAREVIAKRFAENAVDNAPEYLHQVGLHYWAECDYLGGVTAKSLGVHPLRLPSVGFFSSPLTVSYLFGAPRSGVYSSRIMDVKQSLQGAAGQDPAKVIAYMKQSGMAGSYLEGSVFDQLEDSENAPIRGISSMHLIAEAADLGVPIYHITAANSAAVLPLLQLSSAVENDIRTAVNQGKTVLAPERNISHGQWQGVGYIISDETTGAGAYLISGGLNGGGYPDCERRLVPRFVEVLAYVLIAILAIILIIWLLGALAGLLAGLLGGAAAGAGAAAAFAAFLLMIRGLSPPST
ncbi:MAG TPA: transglutaminase-like domain-containing protein, partial [Thermoanaerobaculia bacterium]|nr:transglutaminase-like domain-containing protein [Thermoanaerobaculia bacterium]